MVITSSQVIRLPGPGQRAVALSLATRSLESGSVTIRGGRARLGFGAARASRLSLHSRAACRSRFAWSQSSLVIPTTPALRSPGARPVSASVSPPE